MQLIVSKQSWSDNIIEQLEAIDLAHKNSEKNVSVNYLSLSEI